MIDNTNFKDILVDMLVVFSLVFIPSALVFTYASSIETCACGANCTCSEKCKCCEDAD